MLQLHEADSGIGKFGRFDDLALIWLEDTEVTGLTADINAHHIGEAGGIDR